MQITKRFPYYLCLALLAYMPFHIFLSQSLSLMTGGLDAWKIAKDIVVAIATLFVICLVWMLRKGTRVFNGLVAATAVYAAFHLVLWVAHPDIYRQSAILGLVFNIRLFCFLLLGYGAVLLWPATLSVQKLLKLIVGIGVVVAFLGILQYFLPKDILTHVGYGIDRGVRPAFFIDGEQGFPRIMSTLREPNALGAYLVVPLTIVSLRILQAKLLRERLQWLAVFGLMSTALLLTFSRSAWIGAFLALVGVALWSYRSVAVRLLKRFGVLAGVLVLLTAIGLYSQRHSSFVTSYIIHSSSGSQDVDSNDYHIIFVKQGLEGIKNQPLGHGPGTAGLASIQNPQGSFLTENYYVQIGYEVGILGLAVFVAVQVWIFNRLWRQRDSVLGGTLLASFCAYVVINMVLHIWSNEAVAAQWWILSGIALALPPALQQSHKSVQK